MDAVEKNKMLEIIDTLKVIGATIGTVTVAQLTQYMDFNIAGQWLEVTKDIFSLFVVVGMTYYVGQKALRQRTLAEREKARYERELQEWKKMDEE
jgi:high-affinity Fe2+/Pb2+ permease